MKLCYREEPPQPLAGLMVLLGIVVAAVILGVLARYGWRVGAFVAATAAMVLVWSLIPKGRSRDVTVSRYRGPRRQNFFE